MLLIVLESFSGVAMESLGGIPGVMPNLEKIASEGILFTNFYANSFRTDRGLTSILSGYPAQPTASIMKYPAKSQSLPGISKSLRKAGYDTQFLYGVMPISRICVPILFLWVWTISCATVISLCLRD